MTASPAPSSAAADARAGIQKAMDDLIAAIRRGTTAEEAYALWYTDDLVLTNTGDRTYHGLAEFRPTLAEWVKYQPVGWEIVDPVKVHGAMAVAFIIETYPTGKPDGSVFRNRALYVFEHGPNGWRACRQAITGRV